MSNSDKNNLYKQLNKSFLNEITIEELEDRLEMDIISVGELFHAKSSLSKIEDFDSCCLFKNCNEDFSPAHLKSVDSIKITIPTDTTEISKTIDTLKIDEEIF